MYTVSQAAALSGVATSTLRAWERRYGIIQPTRSEGGYRLYDANQIEILREMAARVGEGMRAAQAAASLTAGPVGRNAATPTDEGGDLVEAVSSLDPGLLSSTVDRAFGSGSFDAVIRSWLIPQLGRIGQAWATGEISVAQEHQISAELMRALSNSFHESEEASSGQHVGSSPGQQESGTVRPGKAGPIVLVGLPPGARHEIAVLAFATCLRRLGARVVYLGADLPASDWREAATKSHARVAVIGAHSDTDAAAANLVVRSLSSLSPRVPVWVGGSARGEVSGATPLTDDVVDAAHELHRAMLAGRA
ncbi:MerR family transcriptional regulator [Aestuariimicrobium soli]|uniref:MerR family transcriptional regulator n=1 Tax=Aestuariimicrobium soli TaxID=2035834 RepID=UPI003EB77651